MNSEKQSTVGQRLRPQSLPAQEGQAYPVRWADAQYDGTIEAIDDGIATMVRLVSKLIDSIHENESDEVLDAIEWTAYVTCAKVQVLASLTPGKRNQVKMDLYSLFCAAIGQYLPFWPPKASHAVRAGIKRASRDNDTALVPLSQRETEWQHWLFPRLSAHLVLTL